MAVSDTMEFEKKYQKEQITEVILVKETVHVFIIGSKGIPARYGGFESFVDRLVYYKKRQEITYHVACMTKERGKAPEMYGNAECFYIYVPAIGPAKAVYYDLAALRFCLSYVRRNHIRDFKICILACRIGPFIGYYVKKIHKLGGRLYVNPDGHEWLRAKWNALIKKYWKFSERLMVKNADLLICDSQNIEKYIQKEYRKYRPKTCFIAYGAELAHEAAEDIRQEEKLQEWYKKKGLTAGEYYLVVGRFVPENNYETMLREFMKSCTEKPLVLITNVEKNKFYQKLKKETDFEKDKRIRFVGTVYDQQLMSKIRGNAFAYLHGHEVGGTNPSLLEALASTKLNLLLDVGFNREVAQDSALYWKKTEGSLAALIKKAEQMTEEEIAAKGRQARQRIKDAYEWGKIVNAYEEKFIR